MSVKYEVVPPEMVRSDETLNEFFPGGVNLMAASPELLELCGHKKVAAWLDPDDGSVWVVRSIEGQSKWVLYVAGADS